MKDESDGIRDFDSSFILHNSSFRKGWAVSESEPTVPSPEDLKAAFKAFKRRIKLTRLDEESKLGYRPTTSGLASGIVAITPPNQFSQAVWEELVRQGKLKSAGHGMYELAGE